MISGAAVARSRLFDHFGGAWKLPFLPYNGDVVTFAFVNVLVEQFGARLK